MRRLLVSCLLVLTLPGVASATTYEPRIVGGDRVQDIGDYPWQVAVNASFGDCGGTLIGARYVLTAEHCKVQPGDTVRANSIDWSAGGQLIAVTRVFRHDQASAGGGGVPPRYDLNILELAAAVIDPKPLEVVASDDAHLWAPGETLRITGWGTLSSGGILPERMQEADVPAVSDTDCAVAYAEFTSSDMFCAGLLGVGGVDTCQGDSGGPIAAAVVDSPSKDDPADWRLVGVTSWGTGCALPDKPGVYARLGDAVLGDWVREFLADPPADPRVEGDPPEEEVPAVLPPQNVLPLPEDPTPAVLPLPTSPPVAKTPPATAAVSLAVRRRCTRRRRCSFTVTPSGQVASVRATVSTTTRRACRRGGRRTTCKRVTVRTLKVRRGATAFTTVTATLRKGAHSLAVTPLDADGKRLAAATRSRFSLR